MKTSNNFLERFKKGENMFYRHKQTKFKKNEENIQKFKSTFELISKRSKRRKKSNTHRIDDRVGGEWQVARERRHVLPERPGAWQLRSTLLASLVDIRRSRFRIKVGNTTQGQTDMGTIKSYAFFTHTRNLATRLFAAPPSSSGAPSREKGERQHPPQREHGVRQHDVQADRVGKRCLHPLRDQEVLGWPATREPLARPKKKKKGTFSRSRTIGRTGDTPCAVQKNIEQAGYQSPMENGQWRQSPDWMSEHIDSQPKRHQNLSADHRLLRPSAFLQNTRFRRFFNGRHRN